MTAILKGRLPATEHGKDANDLRDHPELVTETVRNAVPVPDTFERTDTGTTDPVPPFDLEAARVGDLIDQEPPPRQWLVRDVLPLGLVGVLGAAGGTGKSMAMLQLAVGICTGLPWLGMQVDQDHTGAVLMLSTEDDRDEIHRRLHSVLNYYRTHLCVYPQFDGEWSQHEANIRKRLFVFDRVGEDNLLTRKSMGETCRTELAERVIRTAQASEEPARLIVLDPLSRFDGGDPNDNADGTRLIEAAEHIRKSTGATVLLPHHVSKASMKDTAAGQEALRGASGLVDGARWVGLLRGMSDDQAKHYGVDEEDVIRFVRFAVPMANYGPNQGGTWMERWAGGVLVPADLKRQPDAKTAQRGEDAYAEILPKIVEKVRGAQEKGEPLTRRRLRDYAGASGIFGVGDQRLRGMVERAIDEGSIVEHDAPSGHGTVLKTW